MRIIGGAFKGRQLIAPKSNDIRPTTDRTRETLFNIIVHTFDEQLIEGRVLDCFAGTGALGLEALSRGAKFALFIDQGVEARALIRENIQNCGVAACTKLINRNACEIGTCHPFEAFTLIFLDPPYHQGLGERSLISLIQGNWLAKNAIVILEEDAAAHIEIPTPFEILDTRIISDSKIWFLQQRHCANAV